MNMVLITIAFLALTAGFVVLHLRRTCRQSALPAAPCPRCGAPNPRKLAFCPRCGAPFQAFEIVSARLAPEAPAQDGPLHAIVRADRCVGCGTCVDACPEEGAIRLVNKIATVDLARCVGHGLCAAACPVGGIAVTSGTASQRVEVPDLTTNFETNLPGLYVVGELGGRGLIKNAINEGKIAVEHCAAQLRGRTAAAGAADLYDIIIVGSGPAGLSAGLEAVRQGLRYVVLEQGTLSDTIAKYPRRKLLFAEPLRVPVYGDLWVSDASKEELLTVWQNIIAKANLAITTGSRVRNVERKDGAFAVSTDERVYVGSRVVLAMGRRGTPRRLGVPGEELDKVFYDVVEMEAFAGQRVLVVGGGDSAIESAVGLAHQPDTPVTLSYRGGEFARVRDRNREKLGAAVAAGQIELLLESNVKEIRPEVVVLEHRGTLRLLPNDTVIVRIGGDAPYPFLERIGVRIVQKEIAVDAVPA